MCRSIKPLFNFEPTVTDQEIQAAALQYVRKVSGFYEPSHSNQAAFLAAVQEISAASKKLLHSLHTTAAPKNRQQESAKAHGRAMERFGK